MINGKIEFRCNDKETAMLIVKMFYDVCKQTPGVMAWGNIEGEDRPSYKDDYEDDCEDDDEDDYEPPMAQRRW